jgi:hypothetical protein
MRENYSDERRKKIGELNKNKTFSPLTIKKMSLNMLERLKDPNGLKAAISKANSKPVQLKDLKNNVINEFLGVRALAKYLGCYHKTVNKAIYNKTPLKKLYLVRYKIN